MSEAGRGVNLVQRVAVGAVAVPAFVLMAWVGGLAFVALVSATVVLGLFEFYRMAEAKGHRPFRWLGVIGGLALCVAAWTGETRSLLTLLVGAVLVAAVIRRSREETLAAAAITLVGLLWIGWLGSYLVLLRELPRLAEADYGAGARYVWLVLALTWTFDTAAYAVGMMWGKHRLLERVSPKKSVEGALGGTAACLGMGVLAREWFAPFLSDADVVILGLAVSVFGQAGDFVESMVKRDAGVKDASNIIPGHGGILDRFDSMFFSAPVVFLYLRFFVLK